MATIVITTLGNVSIDGVSAGSFTSAARNRSGGAPAGELQTALESFLAAKIAEKDARIEVLQDERTQAVEAHAAEIAAARAELEAERDVLQGKLAEQKTEHGAKLAEKQALIDAMGGTEEGKRLAREARRAAAEKRKADADAELAVLDAEGGG